MELREHFEKQFGGEPSFAVLSPGRVNLIGEHVDYNDGFVLPMAVPLRTALLLRARGDNKVVLYSPVFGDTREFELGSLSKQGAWVDYAQGVASELAKAGVPLKGFEGVVTTTVPLASGLSSSASFEVGVAMAFLHLAGTPKTPAEVALLCQAAENKFIGVNCGIMDQMAVAACTKDNALLLDCRSLEMRQVPFKLKQHAIVVTDSDAPRELASSAYNERRAQCEAGLAELQKHVPEARSLRDISPEQLAQFGGDLDPVVRQRVEHIVGEIARTELAVRQLEAGDLAGFGERMNESHYSLRDLYEVTSPELDWLTDWARRQPGVLGSRMTGAGFGGCTVTLIEADKAEAFIAGLVPEYRKEMGRNAQCWVTVPMGGAESWDLS